MVGIKLRPLCCVTRTLPSEPSPQLLFFVGFFLDMVFCVSLAGFLCNLLTSGIIGKHLCVLLNAFFLFLSIPDVFNSKLTVK